MSNRLPGSDRSQLLRDWNNAVGPTVTTFPRSDQGHWVAVAQCLIIPRDPGTQGPSIIDVISASYSSYGALLPYTRGNTQATPINGHWASLGPIKPREKIQSTPMYTESFNLPDITA